MDAILDLLNKVDLPNWFVSTGYLCLAIISIAKIIEGIGNVFDKPVKWAKKQTKDHELIELTAKRLEELDARQKQDTKQSIKHDEMMREDISKLATLIQTVIDKQDAMEKKNDESTRAKLKEKLATLYRKYHVAKKWTKMEKEAYDGLIKDYEQHGGTNSFVHDICQPESFTWEIVDDD